MRHEGGLRFVDRDDQCLRNANDLLIACRLEQVPEFPQLSRAYLEDAHCFSSNLPDVTSNHLFTRMVSQS